MNVKSLGLIWGITNRYNYYIKYSFMNKRSSRFKFYLELLLRLTEIIKTAIFIVVYLKIFEVILYCNFKNI